MNLYASIGNLTNGDLKMLMWCVIAGICLALFITFINKSIVGAFIKALFDNVAFDDYTAKSAKELGFDENSISFISVKKSETMRKIVKCIFTEPENSEITADTKLYIDPQMKTRAEEQYILKKDEIITIFVGIFICVVVGLIVTIFI